MSLIQKIFSYIHLRRLGVKNAWTRGPLLAIDYLLILICVCSLLIAITLYYKVEIDNAFTEKDKRAQQAKTSLDLANETINKHEKVIISMLKGRVKVDGITRTVCLMKATGECL